MKTWLKENWQEIMQITISFVAFCLILFFIDSGYITIGVPIFFLILITWAYFEKVKECNKWRKENDDLKKIRYERKN